MSLISRRSIALALLAMAGAAASMPSASAQMPAARYQPGRHHRMVMPALPITNSPALTFGQSSISAPRSGSRAADTAMSSPFLIAFDPWTAKGPATLQNGGGAFGGFNGSYDGGIGQSTSGRMVAVAADPTDANTYYIAAAGGGVWKTTDGGSTYKALTDFLGDTAMGSIAVAPSNHNVVYAGTGEPNFAGDSRYGIGLLRSTDAGASWSVIPGPVTASSPNGVFYRKSISRIVVSPTNPKVVYLSTVLGALNGNGFADGGVWKTTDGGATWTNLTAGKVDDNALFTDVAVNTHNPNILYTAVGYPGAYAGNGIFKTTDGGATWTQLTGGLPLPANGDPVGGQTTLALYSSADGNSDTLYVSIPSSGTAAKNYQDTYNLLGLYKSTDSGATFTDLNAPDYMTGQGFYDNAVVVSQSNPNVFFAAGKVNYAVVGGFYPGPTDYNNLRNLVGTTDGGATFHDYSLGGGFVGPHTDTHALTFTADGKLLDANDGGIWRLENPLVVNPTPPASDTDASNDNIKWSDINGNLNTLQFTGIALDPFNAGIAYGGAQDNGTSKLSGGVWNQVIGGDGGFTHVDATNSQTVYQEFYGISLERSDDGGQTFNPIYHGINTLDNSPSFGEVGTLNGRTDPSPFYVPYKLDPLNQSRIVFGTNNIYFSPDRGGSVVVPPGADPNTYIAGDFVKIGISGPNGNGFAPNAPAGASVDALGVAGATIYAEIGTHVFATFDNGVTWSDRSIPATLYVPPTQNPPNTGQAGNALSEFYVNPGNSLDVYATKPAFDDNSIGKIFRSTDGGLNWKDISGNLPDIPFNSVRLDRKSGTLYVAGDDGVYFSTNYGGSWGRIGGSLPTVQVVDLDVSNPTGLLGAGTHGRGLWTTPLSPVIARPNLKLVPTVTRLSASVVQVKFALSNFGSPYLPAGIGNGDALNTALNVTLNGKGTSPVTLGPVPAYGSSQSATATFTNVPAGYASLHYSGTYTGSSFIGTLRVRVP